MAQRTPRAPQHGRQDGRARERPVAPISSLHPSGSPWRRRSLRFARRLLALGAFAAAAFLAYSFVAEPLLERSEEEAALADEAAPNGEAASAVQEEPPPRPDTVPQRIPQWAWDLNEWHSTPQGERGARPEGAPARVPDWYWEWRAWRQELAAGAGS
jgi:hypothetical protein